MLSYHHLWESLAIDHADLRRRRIRLLRSIPRSHVDYPPYLEAHEFLDEVRRFRPGWISRFPDPGQAEVELRFHKRLWHIAEHEDDVVKKSTDVLREMTRLRRAHATAVHKALRHAKLEGGADITELTLGDLVVKLPVHARGFADPVAFWRRQALSSWHGAVIERDPGVSDWIDYIGGYLNGRAITSQDFVRFWLDDARAEAMPRSFVQWAAVLSQLDFEIRASDFLDTDHVAASLNAGAFVTEDGDVAGVAARVKQLEGRLPQTYLARRVNTSAVAAVEAALQSGG